jgi:hypothetical protein
MVSNDGGGKGGVGVWGFPCELELGGEDGGGGGAPLNWGGAVWGAGGFPPRDGGGGGGIPCPRGWWCAGKDAVMLDAVDLASSLLMAS